LCSGNAEAWRELPESYDGICKLQLRKYKDFGDYTAGPIVKNKVGYANLEGYGREHWEKDNNNNLTDTLISLLIWAQEYIAKEWKEEIGGKEMITKTICISGFDKKIEPLTTCNIGYSISGVDYVTGVAPPSNHDLVSTINKIIEQQNRIIDYLNQEVNK